jgi:ssDNA-binding Zn-finger/Zn-ribbon topoisomerase 1
MELSMRDLFGVPKYECEECGTELINRKRKDRRFCSDLCNNRNWRKKQKAKLKLAEEIIAKHKLQIAAE